MKKVSEIIEISVNDYVALENETRKIGNKIERHDVYKMIKNGELKARKGYRGAWVIELEVIKEVPVKKKNPSCKCSKKVKAYTVKEFVEAYNKKFTKAIITVAEVRKLIADDKIEATKVGGKWAITTPPSKRIK